MPSNDQRTAPPPTNEEEHTAPPGTYMYELVFIPPGDAVPRLVHEVHDRATALYLAQGHGYRVVPRRVYLDN